MWAAGMHMVFRLAPRTEESQLWRESQQILKPSSVKGDLIYTEDNGEQSEHNNYCRLVS